MGVVTAADLQSGKGTARIQREHPCDIGADVVVLDDVAAGANACAKAGQADLRAAIARDEVALAVAGATNGVVFGILLHEDAAASVA